MINNRRDCIKTFKSSSSLTSTQVSASRLQEVKSGINLV
jgi:hypothetical protein